jgi:hypothetical protein
MVETHYVVEYPTLPDEIIEFGYTDWKEFMD